MHIPSDFATLYNEVCDELLTHDVFSRPFVLSYHKKHIECPNCHYDDILKTSSGKYKSGGSINFSSGICPFCKGDGLVYTNLTETVSVRAYFSSKDFKKIVGNYAIPENLTTIVICAAIDGDKFSKMEFCTHNGVDYALLGSPQLWGFGDRYRYVMLRSQNNV